MEVERLPVQVENQQAMAAYMKNHLTFLGLKAPLRKALTKDLLRKSRELSERELLQLIEQYYQQTEREYHYVAIDLATVNVRRLSLPAIFNLANYVSEKSWWDSVDAWRKVFGLRIRYYPTERLKIFNYFYHSQDFWQRRVAINLQLMEKSKTDLILLTQAILQDRQTDEFFIQKAIGWSLRQYSKTDPKWVEEFLLAHRLSPLAEREASKHLKVGLEQ